MNESLLKALHQNYIVDTVIKPEASQALPQDSPIIKVIGVGGGGSNAVNYMYQKISNVEFVVCNTDRQALLTSPVPTRIQLGATSTEGLGAGTEAAKGREAAEETLEEIKGLMGGATKMVFITAGMGGGTGTGAAPVIAHAAKEAGMLTVAVVTSPYEWEGLDKKEQALEGINLLKQNCDTVLVVLNDKLEEFYEDMPMSKAFAQADNILLNAVKSIAEIITTSGNVNMDFMDVKKVLQNAGQSVMGTAEAQGADRAQQAIADALNSPLLNDHDIKGAKRILVTLASSSKKELTVKEQKVITRFINEKIETEARSVKVGIIMDDSLADRLRVTVVAAGFGSTQSPIHLPEDSFPKRDIEEVPTQTEVDPGPAESPSPPATAFEPSTPTATVSAPEISSVIVEATPQATLSAEYESESSWSREEFERIRSLVRDFRKKLLKPENLDTPAYKRSQLELFRRPNIADSEMVQYKLN